MLFKREHNDVFKYVGKVGSLKTGRIYAKCIFWEAKSRWGVF
jgi:hypothetical protein